MDQNSVQALLRLEVDLARLEGRPHFREALASLVLAQKMGETMYEALALLDCSWAGSGSTRDFLAGQVQSVRSRFSRGGRLAEEVEGLEPASSTGLAAREFLRKRSAGPGSSSAQSRPSEVEITDLVQVSQFQGILLVEQSLLIYLRSGELRWLHGQDQLVRALRVLGEEGPRGKEEFFHDLFCGRPSD